MFTNSTTSLKQPKALLPLCATEMWERFGFYIIQGLLIILITNHFGISDKQGFLITGMYGALVYIAPIIGGYYADHYLGFRYTVLMGAFFQCIGYLLIATLIPTLVYLGLSFIILGNGFLKPNIASYLGEFYNANDPQREAGFTYYYMGMNTGTFISTLTAGFIQQAWGWHVCFATAAVGMIISITVFIKGFPRYKDKGLIVAKNLILKKTTRFIIATLLLCTAIITSCYGLLTHPAMGDRILRLLGTIVLGSLIILALYYKNQQRRHLFALIFLLLFAVVFWAIFFEMFSVVNLFVERNIDRHIFGIEMPPLAFISLESVFILILGAPLAALWKMLYRHKKDINIALKFSLSLLALALGMWLLTFAIHHPSSQYLVLPGWMILFYLLLTLGEMLLSPIFLSAVTELSPPKLVGFMMGAQYMAIGFGSSISGWLGLIAAIPKGMTNVEITNQIYAHAFNIYMLICIAAGVIILISTPFITKLTAK